MKKILLSIVALLLVIHCKAQEQLAFPFQGGKEAMTQFFKDSVAVSPEITQKRAVGIAVLKFTADQKGAVSKFIVYYADDALFVEPIVDALKASNHQWIIPNHEKTHDFIIQFTFGFTAPTLTNTKLQNTKTAKLQKKLYNNYQTRKPIIAADQVPLGVCTLLPPVMISYDLTQ